MDKNKQMVDEAYDHIERDINDPNFHGISGTSGTPSENVPIELASWPYLATLRDSKITNPKL